MSTDEAYACVARKGKDWSVSFLPKTKGAGKFLARFKEDYANQLLRWRVATANRGLRAEVLKRALEFCRESGGVAAARQGTLTPEQSAEIARLLKEAEADTSPRDPLGIAKYWEDLA